MGGIYKYTGVILHETRHHIGPTSNL